MMCTIIEDLLPASYYSSTLIGVQVRSFLLFYTWFTRLKVDTNYIYACLEMHQGFQDLLTKAQTAANVFTFHLCVCLDLNFLCSIDIWMQHNTIFNTSIQHSFVVRQFLMWLWKTALCLVMPSLWCSIVTFCYPPSWMDHAYQTAVGFFLQADQRVLRELIVSYLPDLDAVLKEHDIGMLLCTNLT